jgi:hypothetical protein
MRHEVGFRFLKKYGGGYIELNDDEIRAKVGHALRDLTTGCKEITPEIIRSTVSTTHKQTSHNGLLLETSTKKSIGTTSPIHKKNSPESSALEETPTRLLPKTKSLGESSKPLYIFPGTVSPEHATTPSETPILQNPSTAQSILSSSDINAEKSAFPVDRIGFNKMPPDLKTHGSAEETEEQFPYFPLEIGDTFTSLYALPEVSPKAMSTSCYSDTLNSLGETFPTKLTTMSISSGFSDLSDTLDCLSLDTLD